MYELRIYAGVPGRVPQIITGLRNNASSLFVKYGFRPVAFWEAGKVGDVEGSVVYLLKWTDAAEREAAWAALRADDEWQAFLAETRERGPAIATVTSMMMSEIPDMRVTGEHLGVRPE